MHHVTRTSPIIQPPELRPLSSATPDSSDQSRPSRLPLPPLLEQQGQMGSERLVSSWRCQQVTSKLATVPPTRRAQEAAATAAIAHIPTQRKQHQPQTTTESVGTSRKLRGGQESFLTKGKEKRKTRRHRPPSCTPPPSSSAGPPLASR